MKAATAKTRTGFENILFLTNFSADAAHAIPFIKKIAGHFQSNLVGLHVRTPVVNPMTQPGTWPTDLEAAKILDKEHREELVDTFPGINTEVLIEEGDVHSCLDRAIQKHNADLVIIGTRGRTGLAKMLLGSVAEEIFRSVTIPVLIVGPHSDPAKADTREILFATDLASETSWAAAYAVSLAQEFQARLTLLHVVPEPKPGDFASWFGVQESTKQRLRDSSPRKSKLAANRNSSSYAVMPQNAFWIWRTSERSTSLSLARKRKGAFQERRPICPWQRRTKSSRTRTARF